MKRLPWHLRWRSSGARTALGLLAAYFLLLYGAWPGTLRMIRTRFGTSWAERVQAWIAPLDERVRNGLGSARPAYALLERETPADAHVAIVQPIREEAAASAEAYRILIALSIACFPREVVSRRTLLAEVERDPPRWAGRGFLLYDDATREFEGVEHFERIGARAGYALWRATGR